MMLDFNVVWLAGMPRSGTSWLSQILASSPDVRLKLCPLYSYEFKNKLNRYSTSEQWQELLRDVYHCKSDYLDQEYLRRDGLVPTFDHRVDRPANLIVKSNRFHDLIPGLVSMGLNIKFVHIVRNPCASLYSWFSNPKEFPASAIVEQEWRSGACRKDGPGEFWGFDDWKVVNAQALKLSEEHPGIFKVIRYEDLVKEPIAIAEKLFKFLSIDYGSGTTQFIELSQSVHSNNKRSVYKKPSQQLSWKNKLPSTIIESCVNELKNTPLERFLYD